VKNTVHGVSTYPAPLILAHGTVHHCTSSVFVNLAVTLWTFMIFSTNNCFSVLLVYVLFTGNLLSVEWKLALAALF